MFEAGYSHFAPQPSLHPPRVRSRPHRFSKLFAHPLVRALTHVPVRPSVRYLPLLCVLRRLPSHRVHAWPSSHRVPNHLRGVLRDVLSEVCCRHCVGVCVAGYSHVCLHPQAIRASPEVENFLSRRERVSLSSLFCPNSLSWTIGSRSRAALFPQRAVTARRSRCRRKSMKKN